MERPLNPFGPSRPVSPGQFVGRATEVSELEAALAHAKRGKPRHFLITGERGVGKTSLLDYIRRRASNDSGEFNFVVVDFAVNRQTTRLDLARALQVTLDSLLSAHTPFKEMLNRAWSFIQRIEAAGFSYKGADAAPENHRDLYQSVADSLCEIVTEICPQASERAPSAGFQGLLLLIDEVDQASADLDIGSFLKYLLERLNRKDCHKVIVGLAGLTESTNVLVKSHPSSLRIFDELRLGDLQWDEVEELLADAELNVQNDGYHGFKFTPSAKSKIFELSGGHPHFVHQFGYSAFENACNSSSVGGLKYVDVDHVLLGAFENRGALDLIGDVYFKPTFEEVEDNANSLAVLDYLSEVPDRSISVNELAERVGEPPGSVTSLAAQLVALGFVCINDGEYRIRHRCFAYWLKMRRPQALEVLER